MPSHRTAYGLSIKFAQLPLQVNYVKILLILLKLLGDQLKM